jgi:hypothetical protein
MNAFPRADLRRFDHLVVLRWSEADLCVLCCKRNTPGTRRISIQKGLSDEGELRHLTRVLRISTSPTSDNLTPQEIPNEAVLKMGPDGAGLSSSGSGEVAEEMNN